MRKYLFALVLIFTTNAFADEFVLSSEGFAANTLFPVMYACDGKNVSPPLNWMNVPTDTVSLSLIVSDRNSDKPTYQWIVYDIPPSITSIDEKEVTLPAPILIGTNSWNKVGYSGLCPPMGKLHTYDFTLYALNKKLDLPSGATAQTLLRAMEGNIIQKTTLTASYSRWPWKQ